jgi:hypothetical protein
MPAFFAATGIVAEIYPETLCASEGDFQPPLARKVRAGGHGRTTTITGNTVAGIQPKPA